MSFRAAQTCGEQALEQRCGDRGMAWSFLRANAAGLLENIINKVTPSEIRTEWEKECFSIPTSTPTIGSIAHEVDIGALADFDPTQFGIVPNRWMGPSRITSSMRAAYEAVADAGYVKRDMDAPYRSHHRPGYVCDRGNTTSSSRNRVDSIIRLSSCTEHSKRNSRRSTPAQGELAAFHAETAAGLCRISSRDGSRIARLHGRELYRRCGLRVFAGRSGSRMRDLLAGRCDSGACRRVHASTPRRRDDFLPLKGSLGEGKSARRSARRRPSRRRRRDGCVKAPQDAERDRDISTPSSRGGSRERGRHSACWHRARGRRARA